MCRMVNNSPRSRVTALSVTFKSHTKKERFRKNSRVLQPSAAAAQTQRNLQFSLLSTHVLLSFSF